MHNPSLIGSFIQGLVSFHDRLSLAFGACVALPLKRSAILGSRYVDRVDSVAEQFNSFALKMIDLSRADRPRE